MNERAGARIQDKAAALKRKQVENNISCMCLSVAKCAAVAFVCGGGSGWCGGLVVEVVDGRV